MHWFYRDQTPDADAPEVTHRQYACVLAVGSHTSGDMVLLAGEGWGTRSDHEGHGWTYDGVRTSPPDLPAE